MSSCGQPFPTHLLPFLFLIWLRRPHNLASSTVLYASDCASGQEAKALFSQASPLPKTATKMDCHNGEASEGLSAGTVTEAAFTAQRRARFQGLNIQAGLKHTAECLRHDKLTLPSKSPASPTSVAATQPVKCGCIRSREKERRSFKLAAAFCFTMATASKRQTGQGEHTIATC